MSPSITKGSNIIVLAALVLAIALPLVAPGYYVQFAAKAMLMGMLALSLNLVVGYGGLVSLCHAAFFGSEATSPSRRALPRSRSAAASLRRPTDRSALAWR